MSSQSPHFQFFDHFAPYVSNFPSHLHFCPPAVPSSFFFFCCCGSSLILHSGRRRPPRRQGRGAGIRSGHISTCLNGFAYREYHTHLRPSCVTASAKHESSSASSPPLPDARSRLLAISPTTRSLAIVRHRPVCSNAVTGTGPTSHGRGYNIADLRSSYHQVPQPGHKHLLKFSSKYVMRRSLNPSYITINNTLICGLLCRGAIRSRTAED